MSVTRRPASIVAPSMGEGWLRYLRHVLTYGSIVTDDREDIYESGPVTLMLETPEVDDGVIAAVGDPSVIEMYTRKMYSRDLIPELNSTYGDRLFDATGVDQVAWMTNRLMNKRWTKAAAISLLKPNDPGPRIPCLTQVQVMIRESVVELHATFRSQNVGRAYGNLVGLKSLQDKIATDLRTAPGPIFLSCSSPHIYQSDMSMAADLIVRYVDLLAD